MLDQSLDAWRITKGYYGTTTLKIIVVIYHIAGFVFRVGSSGRSTGSVVCSLPCQEMVLQDTPVHVTSIALSSLDFLNLSEEDL